jgi:hypothetical protein
MGLAPNSLDRFLANHTLLPLACFLLIAGEVCAFFRPRSGSLLIVAAVGCCANKTLELKEVGVGQVMALGTWQGLYVFEHPAHPHQRLGF